MRQIDAMLETLHSIGFKAFEENDAIEIVEFDDEEISSSVRILITFEDPEREESDYLFQGCELMVHFDDSDLIRQAKEVKFYVASILNDHGIFNTDPENVGVKIEELDVCVDDIIVP
jgi:hypothetical protein